VNLDPQIHRRLTAAGGFAELSLFQEAVQELEELPDNVKEIPVVLATWLEVYQLWQKWSEASSVAMRLAEIEPEESNWPVALAYATRRSRGLIFAQEILLEASEKFPECAAIQFNLACYAAQLMHLDEARQHLRQAIQLDKEFAALAKTDPDLQPIRTEVKQDYDDP
jgi:lipopolysaccharide biosynthesis regulator YciM